MKQIELWRAKLKAAQSTQRIVVRQLNATTRALHRLNLTIKDLENKIERYMAKSKSKTT